MHVYSFLAGGIESGHLILDDSYWVGYFNENLKSIHTSQYSVEILREKYPEFSNRFIVIKDYKVIKKITDGLSSVLRSLLVEVPIKQDVLIQGFEELPILFFILKAKIFNNRVHLVLTNNICENRINEKRFLLRLLLKLIFKLSTKIIYHTEYELEIIKRFISKKNLKKFYYRKYHLLTQKMCTLPRPSIVDQKKIISFFGPIKVDKPIEPFLNLISEDKSSFFSYKLYNPGNEFSCRILEVKNIYPQLEIYDTFISYEKYYEAVKLSDYIFLSHNHKYSGKLSGNLCDCISLCKPFISDNISPVKEFYQQYGKIGYIFDFDNDNQWTKSFIQIAVGDSYDEILSNLSIMQSDFTADKIKSDLDLIFKK